MSYQEALKKTSLDADASLALYTGISGMPGAANPAYGHLYSFVKVTGSHTCGLCTNAANERAVGVLQSKPQKLGAAAAIALIDGGGVSHIICGTGGLTAGDRVRSDANGHGVTALTSEPAYGTAIESGVAGALAPIQLGRV